MGGTVGTDINVKYLVKLEENATDVYKILQVN
jgi:hypothetical protein